MWTTMLQVMTQPALFFSRLEHESFRKSLAVVLLIAAVTLVSNFFMALPLARSLPDWRTMILVAALVGAVVATVGAWFFTGLIIRLVAGKESSPWRIAAYSLVPYLLVNVLLLLIALVFPPKLPVLESPTTQSPDVVKGLELLIQQYQKSWLGFSSETSATYVSNVWQLLLVFTGVQQKAGIRKALIATLITAVVVGLPFMSLGIIG
jgi:hypothetical protein